MQHVSVTIYAHMQIVVNLIDAKLFSFSIITRPRYFEIGPYLVRLKLQVSRSFLHTVYPSNTARKRRNINFKMFEKSKKVRQKNIEKTY